LINNSIVDYYIGNSPINSREILVEKVNLFLVVKVNITLVRK
jgi:hypothetical protein